MYGCGWCDEKAMCLPGDSFGVDKLASSNDETCGTWFFYNCDTYERRLERSTCSSDILRTNCKSTNCLARKTKYCQECTDYENCFNENNNTCKTWNATRCPYGEMVPDYLDESRKNNTKMATDLLLVDPSETIIYRCSIYLLGFYELLMFSDNSLKSKVKPSSIILSNQAGFIMNQVDTLIEIDKYIFLTSYPISVNQIIEFSDFKNATLDQIDTKFKEQIPTAEMFSLLSNYTRTKFQLNSAFKCVSSSNSTIFIVTLANNETNPLVFNLDINDLIYSDKSNGFLETVSGFELISSKNYGVKTFIKTAFTNCDSQLQPPQIDTIKYFNTKVNQFCYGGVDFQGLYIVDEAISSTYDKSLIAARKSNGFMGKIVNRTQWGDFIKFEIVQFSDVADLLSQFDRKRRDTESFAGGTLSHSIDPYVKIKQNKFNFGKASSSSRLYDSTGYHLNFKIGLRGELNLIYNQAIRDLKTLKQWDRHELFSNKFVTDVGVPLPSNVKVYLNGSMNLDCNCTDEFHWFLKFDKQFEVSFKFEDNLKKNKKYDYDWDFNNIPFAVKTTSGIRSASSCKLILKLKVITELNIGSFSDFIDPIKNLLELSDEAQYIINEADSFAATKNSKGLPAFISDKFVTFKKRYSSFKQTTLDDYLSNFLSNSELNDIKSVLSQIDKVIDFKSSKDLPNIQQEVADKIALFTQRTAIITGSVDLDLDSEFRIASCSDHCRDQNESISVYFTINPVLSAQIKIFGDSRSTEFSSKNQIENEECIKNKLVRCDLDEVTKMCKDCLLCPDGKPKQRTPNGKLGNLSR